MSKVVCISAYHLAHWILFGGRDRSSPTVQLAPSAPASLLLLPGERLSPSQVEPTARHIQTSHIVPLPQPRPAWSLSRSVENAESPLCARHKTVSTKVRKLHLARCTDLSSSPCHDPISPPLSRSSRRRTLPSTRAGLAPLRHQHLPPLCALINSAFELASLAFLNSFRHRRSSLAFLNASIVGSLAPA